MDTHISNDPNNPINYNGKSRYCEICDAEESRTYFVEDTNICESCYDEKPKKDQKLIKIA